MQARASAPAYAPSSIFENVLRGLIRTEVARAILLTDPADPREVDDMLCEDVIGPALDALDPAAAEALWDARADTSLSEPGGINVPPPADGFVVMVCPVCGTRELAPPGVLTREICGRCALDGISVPLEEVRP